MEYKVVALVYVCRSDPPEARCTNSRSGPRTSLGPVALTVGVVLGPA